MSTIAFADWLSSLSDIHALDAIADRITRMEGGLLGDRKTVGAKVGEFRIDVGQGYRLYYMIAGRSRIVLLWGGGKKSQKADIRRAQAMAKTIVGKKKSAGSSRVKERQAGYAADTDDPVITDAEIELSPFDVADYLERESSQIYILRNAFASGHAGYIANAIGAVARARARGLSGLERETGIKRQTLNKSLSLKGNPTLETMMTVLGALGLKLKVVADRSSSPSGRERE